MRVFNFAPGPAALPLEVLEQARDELTDWRGSGMSVMEISHRSKAFVAVAAEAEADLRELLGDPGELQGAVPAGRRHRAVRGDPDEPDARRTARVDYLNTGPWSTKAIGEARRYCKVNVAADAAASNYTSVPPRRRAGSSRRGRRTCTTRRTRPSAGSSSRSCRRSDAPLVADMSSTILSRPIDVSRFGLIYAGAQKNIGPSGLCVVIVREDLLGRARAGTPTRLGLQGHGR